MSSLKDIFISSAIYNSLPYITDSAEVPTTHQKDLDDLRSLLDKHAMPAAVCLRLIHKHFDTSDDEVMVFRTIPVPHHGHIQIMGPMKFEQASPLHGMNYFVNQDGELQAYEYTTDDALDVSAYEEFFSEFRDLIIERGLQRKWGLKIGREGEEAGYTEFEVAEKRSTIMVPLGIAVPEYEYEVTVTTDWPAKNVPPKVKCRHCHHCKHCTHCRKTKRGGHGQGRKVKAGGEGDSEDLYLAGEILEFGTPIYTILDTAIMAM